MKRTTQVLIEDRILGLLEEFLETQEVDYSTIGLCYNMDLHTIQNIDGIFKTWKHYSGALNYPIPVTDEYLLSIESDPNVQYKYADLYEGTQLSLRLSLARHIQACLLARKSIRERYKRIPWYTKVINLCKKQKVIKTYEH